MSIIDLERRLACIEAGRRTGHRLSSSRTVRSATWLATSGWPMPSNWQRWVAQGRATVSNGVLCLIGPELTAEEWAARFLTEY